jgi:hypothetical protein
MFHVFIFLSLVEMPAFKNQLISLTSNSDVCSSFRASLSVISDIVRILKNSIAYLEVSKPPALASVETDYMAQNMLSQVF